VSAVSIILSQDKSSILLSKAFRRMRIFCCAIAVDIMGLAKANVSFRGSFKNERISSFVRLI
jgi:hypothetical protein